MSEFSTGEPLEIERVFLWQDILQTFRVNSEKCGIQLLFDTPTEMERSLARLVLAEQAHSEDDIIQLWADVDDSSEFISTASILYFDTQGHEVFNYELTPEGIEQFSPNPSPLDMEDLMNIRADINEADWSKTRSLHCARSLLFFS